MIRQFMLLGGLVLAVLPGQAAESAQPSNLKFCQRPQSGSEVKEPVSLRSEHGLLELELTLRAAADQNGNQRFCYAYKDGVEAPILRVHPGDSLVIRLRNDLPKSATSTMHDHHMDNACGTSGMMNPSATNLHFHGLNIPPTCHQDEVVRTLIQPGDKPFEYRLKIPKNEPPGLYWYHPHPHGFSEAQVLGGASGALIVEGIERVNRALAGLPERVLIVRDQLATGGESGADTPDLPAKDLTLNFVPVSYPAYTPAVITTRPEQRQLWRVLNAAADTYLDLQLMYGDKPQVMEVVALDGVPLSEKNAPMNARTQKEKHVFIPPGGRAEFVVQTPREGVSASFVTRTIDTGPDGDSDPVRPLAKIVARGGAAELASSLSATPEYIGERRFAWLEPETPIRERKLYFSQVPQDPSDPDSATIFMITVDGQTPKPFDPTDPPAIVTQNGSVEDWTIENRAQELHAFHIHQLHFMMLESNGIPVKEAELRDTINVPYWDGKSATYPSVKVRMDFRDPEIVGTFVYHCHILEHEDGGMMATIKVEPSH